MVNSNTVVVAIYRPAGYKNAVPFVESLNVLLENLHYPNIIIIGDINVDIMENNKDVHSSIYLNLLASHSILPAHSYPTHGKTCLDHVMLKSKLPAFCHVAESTVTDHYSVFFILERNIREDIVLHRVKRIDYGNLDKDMETLYLNPVFECMDTNLATSLLISEIKSKIEQNTKIVMVSNRKRIKKPWITIGLLKCIKNRDKLHKKLKKNPNNEILIITYKRYRNFCNWLLKKLKREYEKDLLKKAANTNIKKLWDTIKKVTHHNKKSNPSNDLISPTDPTKSVNDINNFFANIGKSLAEKFSTGCSPKHRPSSLSYPGSFVLVPIDETEVRNCILNLKKDSNSGRDNISGAFLKRYHRILVPPLTHIFNLMLSSGIFPFEFKLAEIIPIHKSGDRDCVNNYRPISILPTTSKIIEKLLNKRLVNYLESKSLLSSSQFGFRSGISTNDAVQELINQIVTKLDGKKKVLTIFLDLAKAFDTVSVPLLLQKLENMGIRNNQLHLFTDYLTDRWQRVRVGEVTSDDLPIDYGVPQGSVLGPTLFLAYINDLCDLQLRNGKIVTFADDTALIFHGDSWQEVYDTAQSGFNLVYSWLKNNALTLNVEKSKYIPFTIKNIPWTTHDNYSIIAHSCPDDQSCSCPNLTLASHIKYLGIMVDNTLSFNLHIDLLSARTRKLIFIFKSLRDISDTHIINMVYQALCQSILTYCITAWGGVSKSSLLKVERAQRAVLKVSRSLPFLFPTSDLYSRCDVLSVRQLFILHTVLRQHSLLIYDPLLLKNKRLKHNVCVSSTRWTTAFSHRFFGFLGGYLYNKLNKKIEIYPITKYNCKRAITNWLKNLNYEETENLLIVPT